MYIKTYHLLLVGSERLTSVWVVASNRNFLFIWIYRKQTKNKPSWFTRTHVIGGRQTDEETCSETRTMQIFATTWNMGECTDIALLGDLSAWIPVEGGDYDILAVGLQETKISSEMLQAIHSHIGKQAVMHWPVWRLFSISKADGFESYCADVHTYRSGWFPSFQYPCRRRSHVW